MARIISLANLKGGTGKTNVCVNLSMLLSALGKKVLLIDLSPQGEATFCLGIKGSPNFVGDVLLKKVSPKTAIRSTVFFGYDIMPSFLRLNDVIGELLKLEKPEMRLREALTETDEDYDFIIIDTPPAFNILTLNAIFASDELIIPIQCEYLALRSANQLIALIKPFKNELKIKEISALLTMYVWRSLLSRKVVKAAKKSFSGFVFNTLIPRAAVLSQTDEIKEPILKIAPNSRAARAYKQLAEEVIAKTY